MAQPQRRQDPNPEPCVGPGGQQHPASPQPARIAIASLPSVRAPVGATPVTQLQLDSGSFAFEGGPDFSLNALWRWKCSFHCFAAHAPPVRSHTCGNQSEEANLTFGAFLTAFSPVGERGRGRAPGRLQLSVPSFALL